MIPYASIDEKEERVKPLDREDCALLRDLSRPPERKDEAIDHLDLKIVDWDLLLKNARSHGVLPMLFLRFKDCNSSMPLEVLKELRAEYERNVFHSITNAAELIALLKAFEREGIPAMPFKGVVLGVSAYHDLTARPAGDLDLLIFRHDLDKARAALLRRGYELKTAMGADGSPAVADYYEYHFERQADGMVVELRWRLELTQPRFRRNLGMAWVWRSRKSVTLAGAEVPDLERGKALLILCMHGSKHAWSRLIWIVDVAQLLATSPDLNWEKIMKEARRCGLSRTLALGVLLARGFADSQVPAKVLEAFRADKIASQLAGYFEIHIFDAPGTTPSGPVPYNVQLLGGWDRVRMFLSPNFLLPNEKDRSFIRLPKALGILYLVVRPIRILLDRSPR